MQRTMAFLVVVAGLGGCQSMHQEEVPCPYCGGSGTIPATTAPGPKGSTDGSAYLHAGGPAVPKLCSKGCCCSYSAVARHNATRDLATTPALSTSVGTTGETGSGIITASLTTRSQPEPSDGTGGPVVTKSSASPAGAHDDAAAEAAKPVATGEAAPARLPANLGEPTAAQPTRAGVHLFNSKRIVINYEVKDKGPSGVAAVDLYYTRDGQSWTKVDLASQHKSPYVVEVSEEGQYGFTLVAHNGLGLGDEPPHPGAKPQMWAEVDLTKPAVQLLKIEGGVGAHCQDLKVSWKASDKNLSHKPITLYYAEKPNGPWLSIATSLENTGQFSWKLPAGMPSRFLVRIEARDQAGNVAMDQTPRPLLIDLAHPTASIVSMEAARKSE